MESVLLSPPALAVSQAQGYLLYRVVQGGLCLGMHVILVKNVAAFCPCPKTQSKPKEKTFRLIALAKKISKQPNLDTVLWLIHVEDDFDETMQT